MVVLFLTIVLLLSSNTDAIFASYSLLNSKNDCSHKGFATTKPSSKILSPDAFVK